MDKYILNLVGSTRIARQWSTFGQQSMFDYRFVKKMMLIIFCFKIIQMTIWILESYIICFQFVWNCFISMVAVRTRASIHASATTVWRCGCRRLRRRRRWQRTAIRTRKTSWLETSRSYVSIMNNSLCTTCLSKSVRWIFVEHMTQFTWPKFSRQTKSSSSSSLVFKLIQCVKSFPMSNK